MRCFTNVQMYWLLSEADVIILANERYEIYKRALFLTLFMYFLEYQGIVKYFSKQKNIY